MGLHEFYKCEHCPEFHPVELDLVLKAFTLISLDKIAEKETAENSSMYTYRLLRDILKSSPCAHRRYFEWLDKAMEVTQTLRDSICKNKTLESFHVKNCDSFYHLIKCIKRSQRTCVCKLKKILRGQPVTFQYRMVELFTREPSKQWTELFKFKIHVKPLWFTGSRVYQLPTQIVPQSHWRYRL